MGFGGKGGYQSNKNKGGGKFNSGGKGKGKNPFGSYSNNNKGNDNFGKSYDSGSKGYNNNNYNDKGGKKGKSDNPFVTNLGPKWIGHHNCDVLRRISIPISRSMRHWGAVECICMRDGKILVGSRDKHLSIWDGEQQGDQLSLKNVNMANVSAGVTALLVEPNTNWLFVGLFTGQIKAFQESPPRELVLKGHEKAITMLYVFDKFLLSVGKDKSFRVWDFNEQQRTFVNNLTMASPVGDINCLRTIGTDIANTKIWLGGEQGIACINMATLTVEGTINTGCGVVGPFFVYDEYVLVALRDGSIKAYNFLGQVVFENPGNQQTKNIQSSEMMVGPNERIIFMLGGEGGLITCYEVPTMDIIGTISVNKGEASRITAIHSCGNEMFVVGTEIGEIYVYSWMGGSFQAPSTNVVAQNQSIPGGMTISTNGINPFTGAGMGQPPAMPQQAGMVGQPQQGGMMMG